MSQLSFADVFNMLQRSQAINSPASHCQVGQQIAEMVPSTVQRGDERAVQPEPFYPRVFKDTGRHLGRWEVFVIFCRLPPARPGWWL